MGQPGDRLATLFFPPARPSFVSGASPPQPPEYESRALMGGGGYEIAFLNGITARAIYITLDLWYNLANQRGVRDAA